MENVQLQAALYYLKQGFSVIPAKQDKTPFVKWEPFQKQRPTEEHVRHWWGERHIGANIAIITGAISNLTVLDIDTEAGRLALDEATPDAWATPIVDTPSGGEHRYCKCRAGISNAVRFMEGCDIRSEGGYVIAPPSANGRGAWKWRKGCSIDDLEIAVIPESIYSIINAFSLERGVTSRPSVTGVTHRDIRDISFTQGTRDDTIFHVANCLVKGGMPEQEIEQLLMLIGYRLCDPPFPEKALRDKIKSAFKRSEKTDRNLTQEILDWLSVTSGVMTVTECDRELEIVTQRDKANRRKIFSRLVEQQVIQRVDSKSGTYRKVDEGYKEIDIESVTDKETLPIELPFGLDRLVEVMPKDLIVFAGMTNSGKTALLLEATKLNQNSFKVYYFSSEMGKDALKKRWEKRDSKVRANFKFIEDMNPHNILDWLKPNDLNIIDYLEDTEGEPYRVVSLLAKIQNRLKNGVAIVAMQKNSSARWAIGGEQTKSKSSLFCTIDAEYPGARMRIEKAKVFRNENPNGWTCKFKIVNGINLIKTEGWAPEEEEKYKSFKRGKNERED